MFRMRTLYVCASNQKLNSCIGLMLNWERDTPVTEGRWDGSRELRRRSLPARSQTESQLPATKAIVFKIRLMMEPCCFLKLVKRAGARLHVASYGRELPAGNEEEADSSSEAAYFIHAERNALCLLHGSELLTRAEHALFASIIDFLFVARQNSISSQGNVSREGCGGMLKVYGASETGVTFSLTCWSSSPISSGATITSHFSCINQSSDCSPALCPRITSSHFLFCFYCHFHPVWVMFSPCLLIDTGATSVQINKDLREELGQGLRVQAETGNCFVRSFALRTRQQNDRKGALPGNLMHAINTRKSMLAGILSQTSGFSLFPVIYCLIIGVLLGLQEKALPLLSTLCHRSRSA